MKGNLNVSIVKTIFFAVLTIAVFTALFHFVSLENSLYVLVAGLCGVASCFGFIFSFIHVYLLSIQKERENLKKERENEKYF